MDWAAVFLETFEVSFSTILKMTIIIIPLLIGLECLKDMGWMEKLSAKLKKVTRIIGLPGEAAFGMLVAFSVGLVFGSGVIMQVRKEVEMTKKQINTMFIFIGMCHAVIEETIIFATVGANGIIVALSRIFTSLLFGFIYVWITKYTGASVKKSPGNEAV